MSYHLGWLLIPHCTSSVEQAQPLTAQCDQSTLASRVPDSLGSRYDTWTSDVSPFGYTWREWINQTWLRAVYTSGRRSVNASILYKSQEISKYRHQPVKCFSWICRQRKKRVKMLLALHFKPSRFFLKGKMPFFRKNLGLKRKTNNWIPDKRGAQVHLKVFKKRKKKSKYFLF